MQHHVSNNISTSTLSRVILEACPKELRRNNQILGDTQNSLIITSFNHSFSINLWNRKTALPWRHPPPCLHTNYELVDGPPAYAGTGVEVSKSFTTAAHLSLINLITERARPGVFAQNECHCLRFAARHPPSIPPDDYFAFLISRFPFRRRWANYSTKGVVVCPADDFVIGWFNAWGMLKDGRYILWETVLKMVFPIGVFTDFLVKIRSVASKFIEKNLFRCLA